MKGCISGTTKTCMLVKCCVPLLMLASPFTCILISSIGSEDFTIDPVTVTFAAGEGSVTAAVPLTQDMISEVEEQFLLRLIERTSIGGALVEDLVVPPNEATVLIRDPGGELHRTLHSCSAAVCAYVRTLGQVV